jgi:hypothetical protein
VAVTVYVALAVAGAVLVAVGAALWAPPAGLVVAGVEAISAAYVGAYMRNGRSKT